MANVRRSAAGFLVAAALVLCVALGLAACAPRAADSASGGSQASAARTVGDGAGSYVSDEQCLSCHGGSYEALAEVTSSYGPSNPHDSVHGGYSSCINCHARDKEITDNQCLHCHDWPHNPGN
ncbi:hypothetical protein B5F40_01255 [Gordonibacter sp. An230]|uniref:cytochrome c3 family protein n=1 Tax=Gordonibacter sp. An230 TaxID=1965592 RepID=UPI000B37DFF9|nr:cytochrome c3 family protein [Gordonibacter sp. An230]OUO91991.1 hypothetical protein B5F40_01255 [Gordonibacter sp. An230]